MNTGFLINYYSKLLRNRLSRELEKEDITISQFAVIKYIEMNSFKEGKEVGETAAEISERLDMDKQTISGIINRIIDKRYVEKSRNPLEKRSFLSKITKQAKEKLLKVEKIQDLVISDELEGVENQEIQGFKITIKKMIENMR